MITSPPLILASASPRRDRVLRSLGADFEVKPSQIEEQMHPKLSPPELVMLNARRKAEAVAGECSAGLVIGADTAVFIDHHILGKPADFDDALRMLGILNGRTHQVYTGLAIIDAASSRLEQSFSKTDVTFRQLGRDELITYARRINPLDKAGAYAIQGLGSLIVERVDGCYYNVVGLPVVVLDELLKRFGVFLLHTD